MTTKKNSSKPAQQPTLPTASTGESTRVEVVTPELAAEWLKSNTRNRRLTVHVAETIAKDIVEGRWRVTHQGIAFGADGTLYDGQHRLHAIVIAKRPVSVRVTRGLPADALDAIDTGTTRKAQDILAIADGAVVDYHRRATLMSAAMLANFGGLNASRARASVESLRAALAEHGDEEVAVVAAFGAARGIGTLKNSAVAAPLVLAYRTEPTKVIEFARLYAAGAGLDAGHPALVLRNFVLMAYQNTGTAARNNLALRTFSAFEAFLSGETRTLVKPSVSAMRRFTAPWRRDDSDAT